MKTKLILAMSLSALSTAASAKTVSPSVVTNMVAKATYAENRCGDLKMNNVFVAFAMATSNVSVEDISPGGKLRRLFESQLNTFKLENDDTSGEVFCAAFYTAYGPNGVVAAGLVERK